MLGMYSVVPFPALVHRQELESATVLVENWSNSQRCGPGHSLKIGLSAGWIRIVTTLESCSLLLVDR